MASDVLFSDGFRSKMADTEISDDLVVQHIETVAKIQQGEVFWDARQGLNDAVFLLRKRTPLPLVAQDLEKALDLVPELVARQVVIEKDGSRLYKRVTGDLREKAFEGTVALAPSTLPSSATDNGLIAAFVPILRKR